MSKVRKPHLSAVILAAGNGSRMRSNITKQRIEILGKSLLYHTVRAFSDCDCVDDIILVCRADEIDWALTELAFLSKPYRIVIGGKTRAESAMIGFSFIPEESEFVAIHDAARCLITDENIRAVADMAFTHGAATACTAVTDTLKASSDDGMIYTTVSREGLFSAQTPQIFSRRLYADAIEKAAFDEEITDDNMLIEMIGGRVYPVDIGRQNIKVTTADDLLYAEYIIDRRRCMSEIRIGHGYDVHRFVKGRRLVLGGVDIPYEKGLMGHSDADVLTHAIMDALLGGSGLGDIGRHFPDSDERYEGISSLELLRKVDKLIKSNGYSIVNIDATLILQSPKVAPYVEKMVDNFVAILDIERGRINVKATTEEKLGFTGSGEGASAHAVVSLKK